MISVCASLGSACGDDATGDGSSGASTGGGSTAAETTAADPTTLPGTSSGPGSTGSGSTETGVVDSTGPGSTGTGTETDTETETSGVDCMAIAPGPLAVEEVFAAGTVFDGSEDIAFDGQGNVVGKNGGEVRLVASDGSVMDSWPDPGGTYGLRFASNGDLLAAKYMAQEIRVVTSGDTLVSMVGGVNGLYPDFDGNVWFTNFSAVQRVNPDGSVDAIVTGPDGSTANGVVLDPDRSLLYYTNYGPGLIRSVEIMDDGTPGAISLVTSIPGAAPDGLSMDACGNLYVVDQGNSALYRVFLDETGAAVGDPEVLVAEFPTNVANAVFGAGDGWDELSLYAAGVPGGVYRVEVGVPGAPYPTP